MLRSVVFHPEARIEFRAAVAEYEAERDGLGRAMAREVRELVDKNDVVALVADWTDRNPMIKDALAELGSRSIPLLAIYPADPAREPIVLPDVVTSGQVIEALEEAGPSRPTTAASSRMATMGSASAL